MRFNEGRGNKNSNYLSNECLRSDDLMFQAEADYHRITEMLALSIAAQNSSYVLNGTVDYIFGGLDFTNTVGLNSTLHSGAAVGFSGRYFTNNNFEFVASPGEIFSVEVPADVTLTFDTNIGGAYDRHDIIEIRPVFQTYNAKSRQFRDPVTTLLTSAIMNVRSEFTYEIRITKGNATINNYIASRTAGWIKVGEVVISNSTDTITPYDVYNRGTWINATASMQAISGTYQAHANRPVVRDIAGRAQINNPVADVDIANKTYVDSGDTALQNYVGVRIKYDYIIDSDAALNAFCTYTGGAYKNVLVKSGTWTATSMAASDKFINLDLTGTTYIYAEPGSSLVFTTSSATLVYCIYSSVISASNYTLYKFIGLNITCTNSNTSYGIVGFYNLVNMYNCKCTIESNDSTGNANKYNYRECINLIGCIAVGGGTSLRCLQLFYKCNYLYNSNTLFSSTVTMLYNILCFTQCNNLVNCNSTLNSLSIASSGSSITAYDTCNYLNTCSAYSKIDSGFIPTYTGFSSCYHGTSCSVMYYIRTMTTYTNGLWVDGYLSCSYFSASDVRIDLGNTALNTTSTIHICGTFTSSYFTSCDILIIVNSITLTGTHEIVANTQLNNSSGIRTGISLYGAVTLSTQISLFYNSFRLSNCSAYFAGASYSSSYGVYGYTESFQLNGCSSYIQANSAAMCAGFNNCTRLIGCVGSATNAGASTGYGFSACKQMQQNAAELTLTSKSGVYLTCYADASSTACANTAAGGYNVP